VFGAMKNQLLEGKADAALLMYRKIKISPFVAVGEVRGGSKVKEEFRTEMTRTGRGSLKNAERRR
jgi:hypothetical protein